MMPPHAIGIDYEATLTILALREGPLPLARLRTLGDGLRPVIPNVAYASGVWGNAAFDTIPTNPVLSLPDLLAEIRATSMSVSDLWRYFYQRIESYTSIEPWPENGYAVVVAAGSITTSDHSTGLTALMQQAGFRGVIHIPAVDAVLCTWLQAVALSGTRGRAEEVVVLAVGDVHTQVRAYRIEQVSGTRYEVYNAPRCQDH